jgi:hypothetical protein
MSNVTAAAKAGRCEWIGLAVIALPCILYSMDLTVLNLTVPALSADLCRDKAAWICSSRRGTLSFRRSS